MGRPRLMLEGKRFGRLVVDSFSGIGPTGGATFLCFCDCGSVLRVVGSQFTKNPPQQSCGCISREIRSQRFLIHGHARKGKISREWWSWRSMMRRCYSPENASYHLYGGRGIRVCRRWHQFSNFLADMGRRPPGKTLDRRSNDGHYTPDNCRWATIHQQNRNTRATKLSPAKARSIRVLRRAGHSWKSIAQRYSLSVRSVRDVVEGRTWAS